MFGPHHCCSRHRVHLPRHWNFRLNFQPSSIHSLNQLELVRMDIPLSSFFLLKSVSVLSQVRRQNVFRDFFPHLPPFRLRKFRVALRVRPPRLPTQRASKSRGRTGYHV